MLVLDEPSTLLDLRNRELLRRTLAGLRQQVILSTHDLELALDLDRVLVVDAGRWCSTAGRPPPSRITARCARRAPRPRSGGAGSWNAGRSGLEQRHPGQP